MAARPVSTPLFCPECGQQMAIIVVPTATPPFVVKIAGCEKCGVTANELLRGEAVPAVALTKTHRR